METKNNPLAFPCVYPGANQNPGMSLRDYFAAKAMQGLLSNPDWMAEYKGEKFIMQNEIIADVSFGIADAMLKQREL